MNFDKITRFVGRRILQTKKNSPHIFFAVGIVGAVGATVLACRATLNIEDTLDSIKTDLEAVNELETNRKRTAEQIGKSYTEQDHLGDLAFVYGKSAVKLGKLYGPALVVGGLSIFALTGSHVQLTKRNTALTLTLVSALQAFNEYRERVRQEVGEEKEKEIYTKGMYASRIALGEGEPAEIRPAEVESLSTYARMFEWTNPNWYEDPNLNRGFVEVAQNHADHMLKARGHYFLNDAYDSLGLPRTREGSIVGWAKNGNGDGYVEFSVFELNPKDKYPSKDHCMLIDFNVDGVVYHLIGEKECK
jgi:hypothetical protein